MSQALTKSTRQVDVATNAKTISPRVDIFENTDEYLVLADVPGVTSDELNIRYAEGELSLSAQFGEPESEKVGHGGYQRRFRVPDQIDSEKISASLERGVLTLRLPKRESLRPRRIEVKTS